MKANGNLAQGTRVIVNPGEGVISHNNFLKEGYVYTVFRTIHNGQFIQIIGCEYDWSVDRFELFTRQEEFVVGDLVECVIPGFNLKKGQQYTVTNIPILHPGYLDVNPHFGENTGWEFRTFILIKPYMPTTPLQVPGRDTSSPRNLTAINNTEETYPVNVHFIREAHKKACDEWKRKIEKECPPLFKKYPFGTQFTIRTGMDTDEFLLIKTKLEGRYPYASVVSLTKGTSPYKHLEVKLEAEDVAESDFLQMVGNAYITGTSIPIKGNSKD